MQTTELLSMETLIPLCMGAGILYFRSSPGAQKFLGSWDAALRRSANVTEQSAFNAVVRRGMRPLKTHPSNYRVFYGMDGDVKFGILPLPGFLNGHSYFVQRLHEVCNPRQSDCSLTAHSPMYKCSIGKLQNLSNARR